MPFFTRPSTSPKVFEAVQLNWKNWNQVAEFLTSKVINNGNPARYLSHEDGPPSDPCGEVTPFMVLDIPTAFGTGKQTVKHGDWIVRDPDNTGCFWRETPENFARGFVPSNKEISVTFPVEGLSDAEVDQVMKNMEDVSPSEAVYAFAAWLTTRDERTVMSATDDSAPIAALIKVFCDAQGWEPPTDRFPTNVKRMSA